jgi:hypothetical protein
MDFTNYARDLRRSASPLLGRRARGRAPELADRNIKVLNKIYSKE